MQVLTLNLPDTKESRRIVSSGNSTEITTALRKLIVAIIKAKLVSDVVECE